MILLQETLKSIEGLYRDKEETAIKRLDSLAKPLGALGTLEEISAKMVGITGKMENRIDKKNIIVMCGDNGVCEEGVSSAPQITDILAKNVVRGIMGISVLSKSANSELTVVDIGIKDDINVPGIINRKVAYGTKNMVKEPAMTREEAIRAIEIGIEIVDNLAREGYEILGTGELGIGNTTSSAAVVSVLSSIDSDMIVGKGVGLTEEQYKNKKRVVKEAINLNNPSKDDVIDVISKVGGLDIAGLCGCYLGAAKNRIPIVIDGFISSAAALCAYKLNPLAREYMFTSHLSAEPGSIYIMNELGLKPILNLNMRLGEGVGCPFAFNIIQGSLDIMKNMGTFEEALIVNDFLVDIR